MFHVCFFKKLKVNFSPSFNFKNHTWFKMLSQAQKLQRQMMKG